MTLDESTKSGVERRSEQSGAARDLAGLNLAVEHRGVDTLIPYARNARTHSPAQVEQIAASIEAFGWTNPVLVDGENGVIAGHGRLLAARKLGLSTVPVIELSGLSEAEKQAYVIADNKLALNAGWDEGLLAAEVADLAALGFDLPLIGFSDGELRALSALPHAGLTDPDEVPDTPQVPASRLGDVWLLGRHRLACGDCTDPDTVEKALDGVVPHLMVTDPPYGVEYDPAWRERAGLVGSGGARGKVLNDDRADWREAWALFPGDVAYVWHGALHAATVAESLEAAGFAIRSQIIWDKTRLVIGRVEQARDLITVIDEHGVILFKNRSTEDSLGYSPSDLIGRNVFEFIHPDDLAPVHAAFAAAMRGEPGGPVEHRFRYKDGSWRVFESVGCRRDLPVGPIGIVNSHDITARKSLEAQFRRAQRLEVIARTTSDVAHDFRNLLTTIVASADRLLAGEPTPVVRESATQLAEAAQRAETWTHRLLLFARDEATSMTPVVSVNQVVIELTALFHQLLGTNAGLTLNLGASPSWVAIDQVLLEQVLVNLVVNARDAMPSGGVVTIVTSNDAELVAIEVCDTGVGMTEETRSRIFEPFFTTKVARKGSGLGLSIVAGVVRQAGGRVEVVTQYGRGTTFRVTLPARLWMPNDQG